MIRMMLAHCQHSMTHGETAKARLSAAMQSCVVKISPNYTIAAVSKIVV